MDVFRRAFETVARRLHPGRSRGAFRRSRWTDRDGASGRQRARQHSPWTDDPIGFTTDGPTAEGFVEPFVLGVGDATRGERPSARPEAVPEEPRSPER